MRLLGTIADRSLAERFADYMLASGMRCRLDESANGQVEIWVEHDDHLDAAKSEFDQFKTAPDDPKFADAAKSAKQIRMKEEARRRRLRENYRDLRTHGSGLLAGPIPVTVVMAVFAVVVFVAQAVSQSRTGENTSVDVVTSFLAFAPPSVDGSLGMFAAVGRGELWRLITPAFLHFGLIHIFFNLSFLMRFGREIEGRKGSLYFLLLLLSAALVANVAEAVWQALGSRGFGLFGGLSGVNYALFGFCWICSKYRSHEQIHVDPFTTGLLMAWLILCMVGTGLGLMTIANAAHVGGLLFGAAFAYWPVLMRRLR